MRSGYRVVTWSLVAGDWRGEDAQTLRDRLERGLRPGSIALLHDSLYTTSDIAYRDREPTIRAVAQLLEKPGQALRFVTVPELECVRPSPGPSPHARRSPHPRPLSRPPFTPARERGATAHPKTLLRETPGIAGCTEKLGKDLATVAALPPLPGGCDGRAGEGGRGG